MIDADKTFQLLSIDISKLKSQSVVKVYWRCDSCNAEKLKPYRDCINGKGLCSRCSSVKNATMMGNRFGKTQVLQGKCAYCDTRIRSQHVACSEHREYHLKQLFSGSKNPAYVGRCDAKCTCGNKKSFEAEMCRTCSFKSGRRSGANNGRWIEDRGRLISAKIARALLSNTLKSVGLKKNGRTAKMLGYTFEELKIHIETQFEPWMNWQNRGIGKNMWSIDHIIPVTVLLKLGIKDPSIINALWNLRPLSTEENIKRSNNIDKLAKTVAKEHLSIDLL
jgi:hypothetical protein